MLAELAAANAAYSVLKTAISNGAELAKYGQQISSFVNAKADIEKKYNKKKNGLFGGSKDDDLEEFLALEQIRQNEKTLVSHMQLYGRPGLYNDWVKFQAKARVARQQAEKERTARIKKIAEITLLTVLGIVGLGVLGVIGWFIYMGVTGKL